MKVWLGRHPPGHIIFGGPNILVPLVQEVGRDGWTHFYAIMDGPAQIYTYGGVYTPKPLDGEEPEPVKWPRLKDHKGRDVPDNIPELNLVPFRGDDA